MTEEKAQREEEKGPDDSKVATATAAAVAPAAAPDKDEGPKIEFDAMGRRIWRVGNLSYTRWALVGLFFWLLWIDFTYHLMESVFGPILAFKLNNDLNCDPRLFNTFMATAPTVLGVFLTPWISISSDRHRGPRGRRIPYLLYATPVVCAFLALMGFGNEIAVWLHANGLGALDPRTVAIWTFGVLFLLFTIFNSYLQTVFYYLFNDVVPDEHKVKFFGYFRACQTVAGMVYMWFMYQYADKAGPLNIGLLGIHWDYIWYPKLVLVGMAAFYLVFFSLACFRVKEPLYPPPPPLVEGESAWDKLKSTSRTLIKECFSHPFYTLFFSVMTVEWMIHSANSFGQPALKDMGLDLGYVGKVNTICGFVTLALTILTANFGDRIKPVPLSMWAMVGWVVTAPLGLLFLLPGKTPDQYMVYYILFQATHIPVGVVWGMAMWPLFMELLPKARYGQFSSAMVLCRNIIAGVIGTIIAGQIFKWLQDLHGGTGYYNRYYYSWRMVFQFATFFCFLILYRKWKQMGGKQHFKPPVSWKQEYGAEEAKPATTK